MTPLNLTSIQIILKKAQAHCHPTLTAACWRGAGFSWKIRVNSLSKINTNQLWSLCFRVKEEHLLVLDTSLMNKKSSAQQNFKPAK